MSLEGQRIQPDRYTLIPRTLTFLSRPEEVLLIRLGPDRGDWSGLLNGVGGHIERGEDPIQSARREVEEETGLIPAELILAGVVIIDTGDQPGVGLYVFSGGAKAGDLRAGPEGIPEWIRVDSLSEAPLVSDLPVLLPKVLARRDGEPPFSAIYTYDQSGNLSMRFSE
jgi:8-oxo-dGTP diphosphatase